MNIKLLLGVFILSNILTGIASAKESIYSPVYACVGDKPECRAPAFTSDGLAFLNYNVQSVANKVQSIQIHLSKRKKSGWSTQIYAADVSSYALDAVTGIYLSNDAARVVVNGYEINSARQKQYKSFFGEFDEATSGIVLKPYVGTARTPFYVSSIAGESGDLKTTLVTGRYDYACEESRCRYGYVLYSNEPVDNSGTMKNISSGAGRHVDIIGNGRYFSVSSDKGYSIHKMSDGRSTVFIPVETLWKWDGSFSEQFLTDLTIVSFNEDKLSYLDIDGYVRDVNLVNGKMTKKSKLAGIENYSEEPGAYGPKFDGDYVYYKSADGKVQYFNMNSGKKMNLPDFKIPLPNGLDDLAPNGEFMIVSSSGEYYLCETKDGNFVGIAGTRETNNAFRFINKYGDLFTQEGDRYKSFGITIYAIPN